MDLLCHTAGGEGSGRGWRDFFRSAMAARGDLDASESASERSESRVGSLRNTYTGPIRAKYLDTSSEVFSTHTDDHLLHARHGAHSDLLRDVATTDFDFKVVDFQGNVHKVKCPPSSLGGLKATVGAALGRPAQQLVLRYVDEDKDEVLISSDSVLLDAVKAARSIGSYSLRIIVAMEELPVPPIQPEKAGGSVGLLALGGIAIVALIGVAAFALARKKN
ncbi:hypothetical protein EON64_11045 [archaeon]|nr:MAG: hypothetical protein EON64_11045 [archaeon]